MENRMESENSVDHFYDNNNNKSIDVDNYKNKIGNGRSGEKYGLRPRTSIKRLQHDLPIQEVTTRRSKKSKPRPAPLSKYRRKTANARERHRMKAINSAFESLRKVLPEAVEVHTPSSTMTKITTLRLAVDYIRALTDVLEDHGESAFSLQPEKDDLTGHSTTSAAFSQNSLASVSMPYTLSFSMRKNPGDFNSTTSTPPLTLHHFKEDLDPQCSSHHISKLMSYCSTSNTVSASCSPSTSRGSLGSTSDLEELLSDDSGLLEDNLDVFHDIPTITLSDPFEVLLEGDKDLPFSQEF